MSINQSTEFTKSKVKFTEKDIVISMCFIHSDSFSNIKPRKMCYSDTIRFDGLINNYELMTQYYQEMCLYDIITQMLILFEKQNFYNNVYIPEKYNRSKIITSIIDQLYNQSYASYSYYDDDFIRQSLIFTLNYQSSMVDIMTEDVIQYVPLLWD